MRQLKGAKHGKAREIATTEDTEKALFFRVFLGLSFYDPLIIKCTMILAT